MTAARAAGRLLISGKIQRGQEESLSITEIIMSCETKDEYFSVMSALFRDDRVYDHCMECNKIEEPKNHDYILTVPFEVKKKFGMPLIYGKFVFTTGVCSPCLPVVLERVRKEREQRKNLEYLAKTV